MAIQQRNDQMIDLLSADFVRNRIPLMVYGTAAGWGVRELTNVGSTAVVVLPDVDAFDAESVMFFHAIVKASDGAVNYATSWLTPGITADLYNGGGTVLQIRLQTDGSIDVIRTSGSLTFTVLVVFGWI